MEDMHTIFHNGSPMCTKTENCGRPQLQQKYKNIFLMKKSIHVCAGNTVWWRYGVGRGVLFSFSILLFVGVWTREMVFLWCWLCVVVCVSVFAQ